MALPTAYLTSTKRLGDILDAIKTAQAPEKFTQKFLEQLEFTSKGDRLIVGVLKSLSFLDDTGRPTDRYYQYLDQSQSDVILASALKDAYADLFSININAHQLNKTDIMGKFRTLSQGKLTDAVLDKMAMTFLSLVKFADFEGAVRKPKDIKKVKKEVPTSPTPIGEQYVRNIELGGLVYNIQIVLPETRDSAVYDALFKSLKEHLL